MMRRTLLTVVAVVAVCCASLSGQISAQQMGIFLPPEFEMRQKAAYRALLDGRWMESLRQICRTIDLLGSPKNRPPNWKFVKARFQLMKALVLSELGCKKHALSSYELARDVLMNQGNVGANDPTSKARLDFVAASIHRPEFIGDVEGDPQRWRQALERCGQEMDRIAGGDLLLEGKQRVELARVCMFLARRNYRERGDLAERDGLLQDAANYLDAAREKFAPLEDWKLVCDPTNPVQFKLVDKLQDQGVIAQGEALAIKERIQEILAEWTNWRLAQAELQAEKQEEDPALGWGFDRANVEFDKMLNFLAAQYGRGDHPVVFKTRLTRAKWYFGSAVRDITRSKLDGVEVGGGDGGVQQLRKEAYCRAVSYLVDALGETRELQSRESSTDLMKKGCIALEKEILELRMQVEDNARGMKGLLPEEMRRDDQRKVDRERIAEIQKMFEDRLLERDASSKVNHIGCPVGPQ